VFFVDYVVFVYGFGDVGVVDVLDVFGLVDYCCVEVE